MDFVQRERPDIFCLQETKAHPEQVEPMLLCPLEMQSYWSSAERRGYSGTATFVRSPVDSVEYGIGIPKFDREGRFVVTDHGEFLLFNVYFPNGGMNDERHQFKQEFLHKFLRHLRKVLASKREVIVLGDYNVAHRPIDVYDPIRLATASGFLPEEREWFDQFLAEGFHDVFRELHQDEAHRYSWWSYRENARIGNRGWRIDYICVSRGLRERVKSADILDQQTGSDHCPVVVELQD